MSYFERSLSKSDWENLAILAPFDAGDLWRVDGVVFVWKVCQIAEISAPKYSVFPSVEESSYTYSRPLLRSTSIRNYFLFIKPLRQWYLYLRTRLICINLNTASRDIRRHSQFVDVNRSRTHEMIGGCRTWRCVNKNLHKRISRFLHHLTQGICGESMVWFSYEKCVKLPRFLHPNTAYSLCWRKQLHIQYAALHLEIILYS